jgi:integrase
MAAVSGHVYLRKGARGAVWYAKLRLHDGRQIKRRLGPDWRGRGRPSRGHLTKRLAEAELHRWIAEIERRPPTADQEVTFGEACEEWLRYVVEDRRRTSSTVSDYRSVVRNDLLPALGGATPLDEITAALIEGYRSELVAANRLAPRTINKHLVILHGIFRRAQRVWSVGPNPVASVERQVVRRTGDFAVLSPDEVRRLVAAAASGQDRALFTTAAFTGLRMGELRALRWADVDLDKRLLHVRRGVARKDLGDTKSHKVRSVPLIDQVAEELRSQRRRVALSDPEALVFPGPSGSFFDDSALRRRFYSALQRAGLNRLRFHDLRHTFGTLAVQVFPLSDVKAYMGHADIQTTMIYVHHVPRHDAAEKLSAAVGQGS